MDPLRFIAGYPPEVTEQAVRLLEAGELGRAIAQRYPERHEVRSSRALHDYVHELKARYLKKAPPLRRVHARAQSLLGPLHQALLQVCRRLSVESSRKSAQSKRQALHDRRT